MSMSAPDAKAANLVWGFADSKIYDRKVVLEFWDRMDAVCFDILFFFCVYLAWSWGFFFDA